MMARQTSGKRKPAEITALPSVGMPDVSAAVDLVLQFLPRELKKREECHQSANEKDGESGS